MAKLRTAPKWLISGVSEAGYYVYFYISGTSTPKDTYTSSTESAANTNPVVLDIRGEADIWLSGTYKVAVYTGDKDVDGVLVWTVDDYGGGESQVQIGEFNLVKNGSFETDAISNGEPDLWTFIDYTDGTHAIDNSDQYHGLNSLKFTSIGSGGGYGTSDYFEVQAGKEIFIDWAMRSTVADVRNVVDIIWHTAAKTAISTTNIYDDSATNPTSWTQESSNSTPPSTARYAQLRVYGCHSSDATSGSTWFDNIEAYSLRTATTTRTGVAEIATQSEVNAGTNTGKFVTPATLPIATQTEVNTGTETVKYVTPETLYNKKIFRGALVYSSVGLSYTTTLKTCLFNEEFYDTDSIHSTVTNTGRLTVPAGITKVRLSLTQMRSSCTATSVNINFIKNGSSFYTYFQPIAVSVGSECILTTPVVVVTGGDYFEIQNKTDTGTVVLLPGGDGVAFGMEVIE